MIFCSSDWTIKVYCYILPRILKNKLELYEGKMLKRTKIKALLSAENPIDSVLLKGWVKTKRDSKDFSFLEINCIFILPIFLR